MTTSEPLGNDRPGQAGAMRRATGPLRRLAGPIRAALADCCYAQRRMLELRTGTDSYLTRPDQAPDTYSEFLLRTAGQLRHEPSAARRARTAPPAR